MSGEPSPQYAITIRLEYPHKPGWIAKIAAVIGTEEGTIGAIDLVHIHRGNIVRDYTIECSSTEHAERVAEAIRNIQSVQVHSVSDDTFLMHLGGKLEIHSKVPLKTRSDLSMAYTPGVARVCQAIHENPDASFNLTIRKNCVAVISDGSAVLGLGNVGAAAAMPVMEGKAILFKEFGAVEAFPLCISCQGEQEIIDFCRAVAPTFGGINLEDIAAPKCFGVEETLRRELDIPVFHDDQHGTAIVVLAGLINALKVAGKKAEQIKVVVSGAGAAGVACTKIMVQHGVGDVVVCDSRGAIHKGRDFGDNKTKAWIAASTNSTAEKGSLKEVIGGADLFLGVSAPRVLDRKDIARMSKNPIIFAMSNPVPEVMPEELEGIDTILATGRSDYPNQINNVLAFPGVFRGALDVRAHEINEEMKLAAAHAIAALLPDEDLAPDYIIPSIFNRQVSKQVATAVIKAAEQTGAARRVPK